MNDSFLHIGIDDTDSTRMGCTTYIAALLVERLSRMEAKFLDYPNLIRLNPNIPWKTRGNGALCLRLRINREDRERVVEDVIKVLEEEADLDSPSTDPGVVFYNGKEVPYAFKEFAGKALHSIIRRDDALKLIRSFKCEAFSFGKGRGLIGAVAAIGETLLRDHTYELIAYRSRRNRGSLRKIDDSSVFEMNDKTRDLTFNNVDYERKRILITPRGPDPILLGIRGESAEAVKKAFKMIRVLEEVERWVIFRTNQGTDAHLKRIDCIRRVLPHMAVILCGKIVREPRTIPGRHVIFTIGDESGSIDCAAYEPTGKFRNIVRKLAKGDFLEVYGGVRPPSIRNPMTINLEKVKVVKLASKKILRNPVCGFCGKHMESMGREKGFRCKKCGRRDRSADKIAVQVRREIIENLYIPPPRAHRHLTKPMSRYGHEKVLGEYPIFPEDFWGLEKPPHRL